mmetsp:Transcript_38744/g.93665  ORF Transcript_38744/g.93665 Transcript_38744/m.93665 type:complete len:272 (-) Transcript_38744:219-1034(-)
MFSSRIAILLTALLATASSFTIQVKDYECQDRSVSADFTDFCNNNMTCTFGQMAYVSGVLNMTDDVVNSWGVGDNTMVYLDSRLHIATYQTQLMDMQPMYLCNQYLTDYDGRRQLNEDEGDGENENSDGSAYNYGSYSSGSNSGCPSAGLYSFENVGLQLPSVPNKVYDWAATGWTGSVSLDMYMDSSKYQLIGRCQLNLVTHMDESSNSSSNNVMSTVMSVLPTAGVTSMIILGTLAALAFFGVAGYTMSNDDDGDDLDFKPMKHHVEVA